MKVDLTQPILNFEGEPVREMDSRIARVILNQCTNIVEEIADKNIKDEFVNRASKQVFGDEVTLGEVVRNVLGGSREKDKDGEESLRKFDIGLKCVADKVDLKLEERNIIIDAVEESGYNRIAYGRVHQMLSGDDEKPKDEE